MTKLDIETLFGAGGRVYPPILKSIADEGLGRPYQILSESSYRALNPTEMPEVYWREMLYRAHWAAISNSIRHLRWITACLAHSTVESNFLAFCSVLRGMTEAAGDVAYSLGAVPQTLADCSLKVCAALHGKSSEFVISSELENALIHFQFARRLQKGEGAPATHKAESAAKYIETINHPDYSVKELYSELCQVVHPAAQSMQWITEMNQDGWTLGQPQDAEQILDLCLRHKGSIEWIQQQSVNTSIFILQVLNSFPLSSVRTESVQAISMKSIGLHDKIKAAFERNGIAWGNA